MLSSRWSIPIRGKRGQVPPSGDPPDVGIVAERDEAVPVPRCLPSCLSALGVMPASEPIPRSAWIPGVLLEGQRADEAGQPVCFAAGQILGQVKEHRHIRAEMKAVANGP